MTENDLTGEDLPPIDLTPQTQADRPNGRSGLRNKLVLAALVAVLGFILVKAITNASVYYLNVDEAIEQRYDLEDRTFRMQGVVVSEQEMDTNGVITFIVSFNDADAVVRHVGEEPTDLFELGMPVVVEGHWDGDVFVSSQILVKHSETYIAENEDRDGVGSYDSVGDDDSLGGQ